MKIASSLGRILKVRPSGVSSPADLPPEPQGKAPHVDWKLVVDSYLWEHANSPEAQSHRGQGVFHPSAGLVPEVGHCHRQIVFDLLCADRSRQKIDPQIQRIMNNGTNRHHGLNQLFTAMAKARWQGIVAFEHDIKTYHPWLPISGEADGLITMDTGHRYLVDFKTIKDADFKALVGVSLKYKTQLNTYMGNLGVSAGYILYENRANQAWHPSGPFRVDFNSKMYTATEEYCRELLDCVFNETFPVFDAKVCKDSIDFCSYQEACNAEQCGRKFASIDKRPEHIRKLHLKVLQHDNGTLPPAPQTGTPPRRP